MQLPRLREPFDLTGKVAVLTGGSGGVALESACATMLSGAGHAYMLKSAKGSIWPGRVIRLAVCGLKMLGDALRDELNPRPRRLR
jgi:NAD(P)-dependent dehydrogenase (short-subunit alcohol dehydrogenase family)